ncbi:MAG: hypothetical protein VXZ59_03640 [Cyanobacteriota bacterium]|nr:hypothetical protein [Cyanobacteriota bacterium]
MITLLVVAVLLLGGLHWLFTPFVDLFTPLLSLNWIGWVLLAFAVWAFSGASGQRTGP